MSGFIMTACYGGIFLLAEALLPLEFTAGLRIALAARIPETIAQWPISADAAQPEVSLVFVGDVMLARNLPPYSKHDPRPLDYGLLFSGAASCLASADIAFCNLECPISGRGKRLDKEFAFNAPPEAVTALSNAGFDVVSLANNHCLDYGPDAMKDTREHLTENIDTITACGTFHIRREMPDDAIQQFLGKNLFIRHAIHSGVGWRSVYCHNAVHCAHERHG